MRRSSAPGSSAPLWPTGSRLDGWDVTLYERHEPGHLGAASGGESRLIRYAHGDDSWYSRSAWRARDLWRELEAETGRGSSSAGIAWFARREDGFEARARLCCAPRNPRRTARARRRAGLFPSFDPAGIEFVVWEPHAGILRAREATLATVGGRARGRAPRPRAWRRPARSDGDLVVWACGAWLPSLFDLPVRVTKQDITFFAADGWATPPVPGWVDYDQAVYGLGDLDGIGVKVAPDAEGPPFDPEHGERTASPETEARARAYLAERFPALRDARSRMRPSASTR